MNFAIVTVGFTPISTLIQGIHQLYFDQPIVDDMMMMMVEKGRDSSWKD